MDEEEQKEELQESFEEIDQETEATEETEAREEAEEAAVEPQPEEAEEKSPTGGELPKKLEQQPTQMFIAKKRDEEKEAKPNWKEKIKNYLIECKRVIKVTKKPDRTEFKTIVKVSGIGILIIGAIGFLINMFKELFF
ncbi:MAG: protein translocase SEC61 complex subunit gamma [Candidatus Woesearchaeota archaeon]